MRNNPDERRSAAESFGGFCARVSHWLPAGLTRFVAPTVVGFLLIGGVTFSVDLGLIFLLHGRLGWPIWLAITVGYLTAFGLSFVLNRWLNFRSHAPAGRQVGLYVAAVGFNYVAILLGIGAGLTSLGVDYQLARLIAGACEGLFMYSALRWVVFARSTRPSPQPGSI